MTRRPKLWFTVSIVFTAINFFGGLFAFVQGEMMHGLTHAVLTVAGVFWMLRLTSRSNVAVAESLPAEHMAQLQNSVDDLAVRVERVGEAQRYMAKVAAEREKPPTEKPAP